MESGTRVDQRTALELYKTFTATSYGESLDGTPRWDMQRPAHIKATEWTKILGRDGDNLQHMKLTYDITRLFLRFDDGSLDISDEESKLLQTAAIIHDWGKSYDPNTGSGGDINYDLKTLTDDERELKIFHTVYDELLGSDDVKTRFILEAIVFKKETKLGLIFDAIERLGYLRTSKIAYEQSKITDDEVLKDHLEWLTANVLANQMIPLMDYSANYTPVKKYLEHVAPFIDEAYSNLSSDVFTRHNQLGHEKKNWFNQSRIAWQRGFSHAPEIVSHKNSSVFSDNPNFDNRFVEDYDELVKKVEACRLLGLKVVLTSGSFDLMHIGHMRYVERAKEYGDVLIVGVDSDAKIRARKGEGRPVVGELERAQMLSHTRGVTYITIKQSTDKKWELIRLVHPDILIATAETYTPEEISELEANYCKRVVVLPPQATTSTSARIRLLNIEKGQK